MSVPPPRAPSALLGAPSSSVRMADCRADVTARLHGVCSHLPPAVFAEVVEEICALKLRWDPRRLGATPGA